MKGKILLIFIAILMMLPVYVKASNCDYSEQARLKRLASNVTTSYDYIESNDSVKCSVTLTNLNSDIYILDKSTGKTYYYNGSNELTIDGYNAGTKIRYIIYAVKANCVASYLSNKYVNLPYYNKYYKDTLCLGMEQYSICSRWSNINISYSEFTSMIATYKSGNNSTNEESKNDSNNTSSTTIFDYIFNFIIEYYVYLIIGVSIFILIIIFVRTKKNSFNL